MDTFIASHLHNRRFIALANDHGVSGAGTVFHYQVEGLVITGTYRGGAIATGTLVGKVTAGNTIRLLYQCITHEGELLAGWSEGVVQEVAGGLTRLDFTWGWLSGAEGGGESSYIEMLAE